MVATRMEITSKEFIGSDCNFDITSDNLIIVRKDVLIEKGWTIIFSQYNVLEIIKTKKETNPFIIIQRDDATIKKNNTLLLYFWQGKNTIGTNS